MQPFSLLIKPSSADCNLRCDYCFYLDRHGVSSQPRRMRDDVLREVVRSYMGTEQPAYAMIWQGGEPTLMGRRFFEKVVTYQKEYGRRGARIANSLQTNATRITDDLAAHLGRYRFLAGCSLDGPPSYHDRYRRTSSGEPTHARATSGIRTLRAHGVLVNALVLVTRANAGAPLEIYRYLKHEGFSYIQFVPCVELDGSGAPLPFTVDPEGWGKFMCAVFDEWYARDRGRVSVRLFESVLYKLVTGQASECSLAPRCTSYFVVEHNGDLYPCDFFVDEEYRIGNIMELSWESAQASAVYQRFANLKHARASACTGCRHLTLCMGDCLKHRVTAGGRSRSLSWLCDGWKLFYDTTLERFQRLAAGIQGSP